VIEFLTSLFINQAYPPTTTRMHFNPCVTSVVVGETLQEHYTSR